VAKVRYVLEDGVQIAWTKQFDPHVPGEAQVLRRLGAMAAKMLMARIRDRGLDSYGKPLPKLAARKAKTGKSGKQRDVSWWTTANDPRFEGVGRSIEASKQKPRQEADRIRPVERVPRGEKRQAKPLAPSQLFSSYGEAKKALGAEPRRDLSLTGALWRSLSVMVRPGKTSSKVRLYFAGSDRSGSKRAGNKTSIRNRDKARLAMYGARRGESGEEKGAKLFELMRLSDEELATLTAYYRDAIRVFR
jgi:hypothetical protein